MSIVKGRKSDVREKEEFSQLRSTVPHRHIGLIRKGSMTLSKKKRGSMTSPEKNWNFQKTGKSKVKFDEVSPQRRYLSSLGFSGAGDRHVAVTEEPGHSHERSRQLTGKLNAIRRAYPSNDCIIAEREDLLKRVRSHCLTSSNRIQELARQPPLAEKRTYTEVLKSKPVAVTEEQPCSPRQQVNIGAFTKSD